MKDAFYFPHFSNARQDRKIRRLRKDLGVEGYGIYFMILEILREQNGFKYPLSDIDLLADEIRTEEAKVKAVVSKYDLFDKDENELFFSPKQIEYLAPYLDKKQARRIDGIKGNLIRYKYITKEQAAKMSDNEIVQLNNSKNKVKLQLSSGGESGTSREVIASKVKESKVKESKVNKSIVMPYGSEDFLKAWNNWKAYKKEQFNFTYKGTISEQAAATKLANDCKSESASIEAINFSIAQGYKGIYQDKKAAPKKSTSIYEPTKDIQNNPDRLKF